MYVNHLNETIISAGTTLSQLSLKGTATLISSKIQILKEERNTERLRNGYDEIINELLSEREESLRIVRVYKEELEKVTITEEDMIHLNSTIKHVIKIVSRGKEDENLEQFIELVNYDTLKTMQLLGFNYKKAIGQPLTDLCATAIRDILPKNKKR